MFIAYNYVHTGLYCLLHIYTAIYRYMHMCIVTLDMSFRIFEFNHENLTHDSLRKVLGGFRIPGELP